MTHTPAPWTYSRKYADNSGAINGPDGNGICATASSVNRPAYEKLANATLIAAAPELLEALVAVSKGFVHPALKDQVFAAIAKATGSAA